MCGIAGVLSDHLTAEQLSPAVWTMMEAQAHRGPDDSGLEVVSRNTPATVFGHRRLAIIDTSAAGHQPMRHPETGDWISFNGEIYNYRELRDQLSKKGHQFRTLTDTEVILAAYAEWGEESVERFRGMFAFALWDQRRRRLLLARDQLGVKPLYFSDNGRRLVFASEVRAILASGLGSRSLNLCGLRSYLAYGSVQDPYTLVSGIESLLPGHLMIVESNGSKCKRYWAPPSKADTCSDGEPTLLTELSKHLHESVSTQLVSDVPLGAFLSGGVDSTAIAALMKAGEKEDVRTLTVGFEEPDYDERHYSRIVAQKLGVINTELVLSADEARGNLDAVLNAFDQPSFDGMNTYFVSKLAREAGLSVALSGVGGDELFGGYDGYRGALQTERVVRSAQKLPGSLRRLLARTLQLASDGDVANKLAAMLTTPRPGYFVFRRLYSDPQMGGLLHQGLLKASEQWEPARFEELERTALSHDLVNRISVWELQSYLLSTLLRDTDQMSMAHALEVRVPLVDAKLVEFMLRIPGSLKLERGVSKPLLTRSLSALLPPECVARPKRGFGLPYDHWLRAELGKRVAERFNSDNEASAWPFRAEGLRDAWQAFERGRMRWSRVWALFVVRYWLDRWQVIN